MASHQKKTFLYLAFIFGVTSLIDYFMAGMIDFNSGAFFYSVLWFTGFAFLTFNLVYMLAASLFYLFVKPSRFKETSFSVPPKTAVVYPVKNEGDGLYERMRYTIQNSLMANVDFWLLSDSTPEFLDYEAGCIQKLKAEFGSASIFYRRRANPIEKKQGNIMQWIHEHREYVYFFVCDADTMLPHHTLIRMLQKAEHPENKKIAIFQSRLEIAHAKTHFARFQATSAALAQKFYVTVNQAVFGRQVSFGHGCLIRTAAFLPLRLPRGIWSHDIWDMVLLDQSGWKTVFCHDVVCYDEVPSHYLELKSRNRRWARGTMQSWPLLFFKNISAASRFYVFYGIYMYICQPVFFFWILISFFAAAYSSETMLVFQRYAFLGGSLVDIELTGMLIFSLAVVFCHKLVVCRTFSEIGDVIKEILLSTLLCLNNVFYQTVDLIVIPFQKAGWIPMKKNPFNTVTLQNAVKDLWPSTLLGLSGFYLGLKESPSWAFSALPFLISFSFIIPLTYLTSKRTSAIKVAA